LPAAAAAGAQGADPGRVPRFAQRPQPEVLPADPGGQDLSGPVYRRLAGNVGRGGGHFERGTERGNAGCFVTSTFFCAAKTAGTCARWPTGTERCCAALPAGWTTPPGTVTKPSGCCAT